MLHTAILGSSDPEMERIESLLKGASVRVLYAAIDGRRVTAGQAYLADSTISPEGEIFRPLPGGTDISSTLWVECELPGISRHVVADHHRAGDPGFGRPAAEFFEASSLGQVVVLLAKEDKISFSGGPPPELSWNPGDLHQGPSGSWEIDCGSWNEPHRGTIPADLVLAAASDHCPAAAYAGQCPGVDPDTLMRWRVETRAAHQNRAAEDILGDITAAMAVIRAAPAVDLDPGFCPVHGVDVRSHDYCECPGAVARNVWARDLRAHGNVPELPEASLRLGRAIICRGLPDRDGRVKINVLGDITGDVVKAFLGGWAAGQGLVDLYGDPARGFAGGYQPPTRSRC